MANTKMVRPAVLADRLRRRGFDKTTVSGAGVYVRCSRCEALVIQGVPTHERGCPNRKRSRDDE